MLKPILGFTPEKLDNYQLAFYHRSNHLPNEQKPRYNNERLEYLGDALLSTVVAEYLFKKYPQAKDFEPDWRPHGPRHDPDGLQPNCFK
jgi:ribonuclease-3